MCGASDAAPVAWSGAGGLDVRSDVGRRRLLAPSDWQKRRRVVLDIESPRASGMCRLGLPQRTTRAIHSIMRRLYVVHSGCPSQFSNP